MIAKSVFLRIRVVRMPGAEGFSNIAVILAPLILIAYEQSNRCACRFSFKDTGQYFDGVGFPTLRHMT